MRYQTTLISMLTCAIAPHFGAQVLEKRLAPVDKGQALKFNKAGTVGVAILVGVGKYPRYSGLSELHYPTIDVDTLASTLKSQRYIVLMLKDADATKGSILNAIQQAGEAMAGENLTAVFFFSGHGFAVNGQNYLATQDANSRDFAASGLSVQAVEDEMVKTHATRRVMWIDACRDEPGKGISQARTFANFQASAGTRLLLSTKAGKVSYEDEELKQGMFSYYLTKGLQGEAAGPDGLITFQDLATYVTMNVRSRSLETGHVQIPYEAGEASGDFLLAGPVAAASPGIAAITSTAHRSCISPPAGLVGWWPGDTGENDIIGENNASAMNSVQLLPAEVQSGYGFGQYGYVEIPSAAKLANQRFTWTAWVRPNGPGPRNDRNGSVILNQVTNGRNFLQLSWSAASGHFVFVFGEESREFLISKNEFPAGAFYSVTGTYDGNTFRLFVNGVEEGSFPESKIVQYSPTGWHFGGNRASSEFSRTWNGVIDELQAFDRALSPAEIQAIYNAGTAGECKPGMH